MTLCGFQFVFFECGFGKAVCIKWVHSRYTIGNDIADFAYGSGRNRQQPFAVSFTITA